MRCHITSAKQVSVRILTVIDTFPDLKDIYLLLLLLLFGFLDIEKGRGPSFIDTVISISDSYTGEPKTFKVYPPPQKLITKKDPKIKKKKDYSQRKPKDQKKKHLSPSKEKKGRQGKGKEGSPQGFTFHLMLFFIMPSLDSEPRTSMAVGSASHTPAGSETSCDR
ncbi:hypothetical protein TWF225_000209 [Orbilia oligospora]|nr:hypothetical protein TWF225_000209 [Orbilia oligospora]